jgi:hypothetical protein
LDLRQILLRSCDKRRIAVRWCLVKDPSTSWRHSRSWRRPLPRQASHGVGTLSFTFIARVERRGSQNVSYGSTASAPGSTWSSVPPLSAAACAAVGLARVAHAAAAWVLLLRINQDRTSMVRNSSLQRRRAPNGCQSVPNCKREWLELASPQLYVQVRPTRTLTDQQSDNSAATDSGLAAEEAAMAVNTTLLGYGGGPVGACLYSDG